MLATSPSFSEIWGGWNADCFYLLSHLNTSLLSLVKAYTFYQILKAIFFCPILVSITGRAPARISFVQFKLLS